MTENPNLVAGDADGTPLDDVDHLVNGRVPGEGSGLWTENEDGAVEPTDDQPLHIDEARIESNKSVVVGTHEEQIGQSVVADDGEWIAFTRDEEVVRSTDVVEGYEVVGPTPADFGGSLRGLHMTAAGSLVCASEGTIYRSTDRGETWSAVGTLPENYQGFWAISENGRGDLIGAEYSGDGVGIWQSTDDGQTWTKIADQTDFPTRELNNGGHHLHKAVYAPWDDDLIIVTGHFDDRQSIVISRDHGSTWTGHQPEAPFWNDHVAVAFHPDDPVFFVGTDASDMAGVLRYRDTGSDIEWEGFQNCSSVMGDHSVAGGVFSMRRVDTNGGSFYVAATRREGHISASNPDADQIIVSSDDEGVRWRSVADAHGGGASSFPTSQGPDGNSLDFETVQYIENRDQILSLADIANPIYGSTLPKTAFGSPDAMHFTDGARLMFEDFVLRKVGQTFNITNLDGERIIQFAGDGSIHLSRDELGRVNCHNDLNIQGNWIYGEGANSRTRIHGWTRHLRQSPSDNDTPENGDTTYFDADPEDAGRGGGLYFYETGDWGKVQLDFGT